MVDLRGKNKPGAGTESGERLLRAAGRMALWSCVLLLLVRGIASVLAGPPTQSSAPARPTITVTQPAPAATPGKPGGDRRGQ
jgi:hypothetical protein